MKTIGMTNDEFAVFMANKLISIENYNFDMFYDITKIMDAKRTAKYSTTEKQIKKYLLCLRPTGSDLIGMGQELEPQYKDRSTEVYEIELCFNCDYFMDTHFATVTQIK